MAGIALRIWPISIIAPRFAAGPASMPATGGGVMGAPASRTGSRWGPNGRVLRPSVQGDVVVDHTASPAKRGTCEILCRSQRRRTRCPPRPRYPPRPRGGASKSASLSTMAFDLADGAGRGGARPPGTYGDVKCGVNTSRRAFRRAVPCSRECKRVAPRGSLCEVARDALIPPQAGRAGLYSRIPYESHRAMEGEHARAAERIPRALARSD